METLPKFGISRADMLRRVARFKDLKGSDGGLPDSKAPQCERTLYNVIGFQPPKDSGGSVTSPVGDDASRLSAIPVSEGFNLGYCRAKPGKGPMMHNHDTNETFIPMTGTWRCSWENEKGEVESIDLNPLDVISFPPGAIRRFENVTLGPSGEEAILMFVIGGDGPKAEFGQPQRTESRPAGDHRRQYRQAHFATGRFRSRSWPNRVLGPARTCGRQPRRPLCRRGVVDQLATDLQRQAAAR